MACSVELLQVPEKTDDENLVLSRVLESIGRALRSHFAHIDDAMAPPASRLSYCGCVSLQSRFRLVCAVLPLPRSDLELLSLSDYY